MSKFVCPFCEKEFKNLSSLRQHITKKHKITQCPICKKPFTNLAIHCLQKARRGCYLHGILYYFLSSNIASTRSTTRKKVVKRISDKDILEFKRKIKNGKC